MARIFFNLILTAAAALNFSSNGFTLNNADENLRYLVPVFDKIEVEKDIVYYTGDTNLTLDLYQPAKDAIAARPVIILAHGGGFYIGDKTQVSALAESFAKRGYIVVSFNYRLKEHPELNWPKTIGDAFEDTGHAIDWVKENSRKYRINTDLIALGGTSAGGMIAHNFPDKSGLFAIISIYGSFSFPMFKLTRTPTILIHGDEDQLVPYQNSVDFAGILTGSGIFNELYTLKGMGHGILEGGGLGESQDFFYGTVSHISMFLYKCMFNYTDPLFKAADNEIDIYPEEMPVLNLHRDKKDLAKSGIVGFDLPLNWEIAGDNKFSSNQESIQIPVKIPVYTGQTNIYLFYRSESGEPKDKNTSLVLIRIKDPLDISIEHPDILLKLYNSSKSEISGGKVQISDAASTDTMDFSLKPGMTWTSQVPENISGRVKVKVILQNGYTVNYSDYITSR